MAIRNYRDLIGLYFKNGRYGKKFYYDPCVKGSRKDAYLKSRHDTCKRVPAKKIQVTIGHNFFTNFE